MNIFEGANFPVLPAVPADYRYLNASDASMRLSKSFIRFRGEIAWASEVSGDQILLQDVTGQYNHWCNYNDTRLDISSIPVGWVSFSGKSVTSLYFERAPHRQQKQGVCIRSLNAHVPFKKTYEPDEEPAIPHFASNFGDGLSIKTLGLALAGKYPTIPEALERERGAAFHRDWAVLRPKPSGNHYVLFHKFVPVGYFNKTRNAFGLLIESITKTRRESLNSIVSSTPGSYTVEEI